jgi:Fur family ferric uptake transcriptional regulator
MDDQKRYDFLLSRFKSILKENALKFTAQREAILQVLFTSREHLTPEELHALLKQEKSGSAIGISTVYRTLNLLEEAGLVSSISFGAHGKKFELSGSDHHDHIICIRCDKIVEFEDEIIEKRQESVAKEAGFELTDHTMQLYGICNECKSKGDHSAPIPKC